MDKFLIEVVEDREEQRDFMVEILHDVASRAGAPIEVRAHSSLESVLADDKLNQAGLVILDLGLPDAKGRVAHDRVREKVHPYLQIYVYSGTDDLAVIDGLREEAATEFMLKSAMGARELLGALTKAIVNGLDREAGEVENVA